MKTFKVFLSLLLFCISVAKADVDIKVLVVDGYGISYAEAIQNGLIEALKQAEGVSISSQKNYAKAIKESAFSNNNDKSTHQVSIDETSSKKVTEVTKGVINQYQILNSESDANGEWSVQLEIQLKKYKTPGNSPHQLRKIAVLPFDSKFSFASIIGKKYSKNEISRQLNQKLVNELTQSRRFTVLDREYKRQFAKEKNVVLSDDSPLDEKMKVGEVLGADYLLLGTITQYRATSKSTYNKLLDETIYNASAYFNVDFRIMVMATRQIKWSDTIKFNARNKKLKSLIKASGSQGVTDYILEKVAQKIVHSSLDNIYPLKVLKAANKKSIYINQGGKMTTVDQVYDVYTPGENIVDPDTGLNIKIDGEQVASVKIIKVLAKYSLAKLIDGNFSDIKSGAILRRSDRSKSKPIKKQRVMQPNW